MKILVTGATGYVGGRLIPRLLAEGHAVSVFVREPARIEGRPWCAQVRVIRGDLLASSDEALREAMEECEVAYYLVHSMGAGTDFAAMDLRAASRFAEAASRVPTLRHTIYLGGLLPPEGSGSQHLSSRAETGEVLRALLPCTEFRAGPIIGSGSASFEMARYLTERLPAMVAPRWIENQVQPIAIRDVLAYLIAAVAAGPLGVVEIGADRLKFKEMMLVYAALRGLRRWIIPVPILAPKLAGLWVGLVTPIPNRIAVPIIQGILSPVLADTAKAREHFPQIHPISYREAVGLALSKIESGEVETRWSGALGSRAPTVELTDSEGLIREVRTVHLKCSPDRAFAAFSSLGGERGWLAWDWAWRVRGLLDRLIGGPGLRRGRRHPTELYPGESLDFWRVERVERPNLLRLRAEMKVPGNAWLQYEALAEESGTRLVQTALFRPDGFAGFVYWHALYPIHSLIFSGMVRALGRLAEKG